MSAGDSEKEAIMTESEGVAFMSNREMKPLIYVHPNAPQGIKDFADEHFWFVERVEAGVIEGITGELVGDGPAMADYALVLLLETGDLSLMEMPSN
jgi:hypothetical protein